MKEDAVCLSGAERRTLRQLQEDPASPARLARRAAIVLELATGASVGDVAERLGVSIPTVRLWRARFSDSGPNGLRDVRRPGRPRRRVEAVRDQQVAAASQARETVPGSELDRLLFAARRTISRRGFAATRVADIAEEAGVSSSTIHYYFRTRNEILLRALLWANETLLPPLVEGAGAADAVGLMSRYLENTIPYPGVQRDEYLLEIDLWSNVRMHRELLPVWESYQARWIAHVTQLIELGTRTGAFTPTVSADELAERLVALTDGLSAQTAIDASRMPARRARDLIFRFASEQLGVPRAALESRQPEGTYAVARSPERTDVNDPSLSVEE